MVYRQKFLNIEALIFLDFIIICIRFSPRDLDAHTKKNLLAIQYKRK